jgi:23S rRNA (cytosine1962-C5)-methyltransferase
MPSLNIKDLEVALSHRKHLLNKEHPNTYRLFNGFSEGYPELVADIYRRTLLLYNFSKTPKENHDDIVAAQKFYLKKLPGIEAVIIKTRKGESRSSQQGILTYGEKPNNKVTENEVRYAIDLQMNQDSSLYLDTSNLRKFLKDNCKGKSVLNTFAYTGSLGVAAKAGGASLVVQMDLNRKFMGLAKRSYQLNGFPVINKEFIVGDFFSCVKNLKINNKLFDCVILDPPFFSNTKKGRVDLAQNNKKLINKLRPLVNNDGFLIVINNALFFSGEDFMASMNDLCTDGYLSIHEIIAVPDAVVGYIEQNPINQPANPAPFNHSTKIVVLKVKRKQ